MDLMDAATKGAAVLVPPVLRSGYKGIRLDPISKARPLVGKIEIDPPGMLSDAGMDDPLTPSNCAPGLEEIEGGLPIRACVR
jgi:hypothetical protein